MNGALSAPSATDPRVEAWLEVATRGLAEDARLRVREEIIDHVAESAAEHRARGARPEETIAAAVSALGDPARAGRALRRANLRPSEAKIVGSLARPLPRWILAFYLLAIPAMLGVVAFEVDSVRDVVVLALGLSGIVAGIAARFWLARALAHRGRLRAALVADVFGSWLTYASLVVGSRLVADQTSRVDVAIYLGAFVLGVALVARMWPKIGRSRVHPS